MLRRQMGRSTAVIDVTWQHAAGYLLRLWHLLAGFQLRRCI